MGSCRRDHAVLLAVSLRLSTPEHAATKTFRSTLAIRCCRGREVLGSAGPVVAEPSVMRHDNYGTGVVCYGGFQLGDQRK